MLDWMRQHDEVLTWLAVISAVTFLGTLVAIPILVARIPADYFAPRRRRRSQKGPAWARWSLLIAKNVIGAALIAAGLAMLLLPGQGLITILIGILLTNFPGKYRLERAIVRRPPVFRAINWIRRRSGRPDLAHPDGTIIAKAAEKAR
jgi:hypothetical protein